MEYPLITVIIPAYNCANTLCRAIDSVIRQSYRNIEILLIDDGSTDNETPQLCDSYLNKDSRIKVFHKKNGGQGSARNVGLKNSHGMYVLFLDSDDEYVLDMCDKLIDSTDGSYDFVLYGFNVYQNGGLLRTPNPGVCVYEGNNWDHFNSHIRSLMSSPCNKFYKRKYISSLFDEHCVHGEDALFNYANFHKNVRIKTISDCLYNVYLDNPISVNKQYKVGRLFCSLQNIIFISRKLTDTFTLSGKTERIIKQEGVDRFVSECYAYFSVSSYFNAFSEIKKCFAAIEELRNWKVIPSKLYFIPIYYLAVYKCYKILFLYCCFLRKVKHFLRK